MCFDLLVDVAITMEQQDLKQKIEVEDPCVQDFKLITWFLKYDTKSLSDKNIDKFDFIKIKNFYAANDAIQKVNR